MALKYDVVYWWQGGSEAGRWNEAYAGQDAHDTARQIERLGYVAHPGRRSIGAPEGPPSAAELVRVRG